MLKRKIKSFAWGRLVAMVNKEFIQTIRDRTTLAMIIMMPLIQLILFGYAINNNPKHLPAVVVSADSSPFTRTILYGLQQSNYFSFSKGIKTEKQAHRLLQEGKTKFIINIPANFSQQVIRGQHPAILVEADATDPSAISNVVNVLTEMQQNILNADLNGPLNNLQATSPPFQIITHMVYNPLGKSQYNTVPGLLGVVLLMTLVIITGMAITRERERGTMEMLLSTPIHPLEVIIGKIVPYILIGYIQVCVVLIIAKVLFHIPMQGNLILLFLSCLPYIAANLAVGLTFSTIAKNQLQAMQMSFFYMLPSLLLSGFMFPFAGMPTWAQWIGNLLPMSHFLIIVRGILLKGNNLSEVLMQLLYIALFALAMLIIAVKRYRNNLD